MAARGHAVEIEVVAALHVDAERSAHTTVGPVGPAVL